MYKPLSTSQNLYIFSPVQKYVVQANTSPKRDDTEPQNMALNILILIKKAFLFYVYVIFSHVIVLFARLRIF